jgi:uncharacterized membrane protein YhhN
MRYGGAWVALPAAILFMVTACGYILAAGRSDRRVTWYTKPFAMPLLALTYLLASRGPNAWILAGLGCGTVGDVFLIRGERRGFFMAGLTAFLFGHLAYLVAFLIPVTQTGMSSAWTFAPALPLAAFGILVYRILRPGLGGMKVPVALYTVVILSMALAAVLRVSAISGLPFWLPMLGALCFIASDTLLAYQQFKGPITSGRTLVAITYVGAQTLIVLGYLLTELK